MTDKEKLTLLEDQLHRIQNLAAYQLDQYAQQVNLNQWPDDVKKWLMKAVDIRRKEALKAINIENAMVVQEELREVS